MTPRWLPIVAGIALSGAMWAHGLDVLGPKGVVFSNCVIKASNRESVTLKHSRGIGTYQWTEVRDVGTNQILQTEFRARTAPRWKEPVSRTYSTNTIVEEIDLGRIGETLEQCRERYGEEVASTNNIWTWLVEDIFVTVSFVDNRSRYIVYGKKSDSLLRKELNGQEIDALLAKSSGGQKWVLDKTDEMTAFRADGPRQSDAMLRTMTEHKWTRSDRALEAVYFRQDRLLFIWDPKYCSRKDMATSQAVEKL